MKRSALILLTAIYLLSIVGIGVNRFYCCGELASVTLTYGSEDHSAKETGKKDNCCKNEAQSFKVKDTHVSSVNFAVVHPSPSILPTFSHPELFTIALELPVTIAYQSNAPPGNPATPIYTLNCTYRI